MKLISRKSGDQYSCDIPNLGVLIFSDAPPVEYCWSGYLKGGENDFLEHNFGSCRINDKSYLLCSTGNAIALLEYLDQFVIEGDLYKELMDYLFEASGMDYWFCVGYESMCCDYDDLPDWCHSIVELYVKNGCVLRISIQMDGYENDVFLFNKTDLLKQCTQGIVAIAQKALAEYKEDELGQ